MKGRLEKIQRDFFWGGGSDARKIHLVNWKTVSQGKSKGGLGIRNLELLNRALLGKWIWRFFAEENSIWNQSPGYQQVSAHREKLSCRSSDPRPEIIGHLTWYQSLVW